MQAFKPELLLSLLLKLPVECFEWAWQLAHRRWVKRMLLLAVESYTEEFSHPCSMLAYLMGCVAEKRAEVMVASHNQASVETCLKLMHELGIPNTPGAL